MKKIINILLIMRHPFEYIKWGKKKRSVLKSSPNWKVESFPEYLKGDITCCRLRDLYDKNGKIHGVCHIWAKYIHISNLMEKGE